MLKISFVAALLGVAIANDPEVTMKDGATLNKATDGKNYSEGKTVEWMAVGMEDDKEYKAMVFSLFWDNKNDEEQWPNGVWIQDYAMWEDEEQAGKYASMTCNVEYDGTRDVAPADKVTVRSLYGGKIDNATVTSGAWNQIGTEDQAAIAEGWKWDACPSDDENYNKCYKTTSTETSSSQACAAGIMMYMEVDGVAMSKEM